MKQIVLVHGAWHGGWCRYKVLDGLAEAGIEAIAVDLPLSDGLEADAACVRAVLDAAGAPTVVIGHSYGGSVISLAAAGATNVAHLVYLCAFQLTEDETTTTMTAAYPSQLTPAVMRVHDGGRSVAEGVLEPVFYGDCSPTDVALARARLRPMPAVPSKPPSGRPAWRDLPSTYIVCDQDQAIHPDAQRLMAQRATQQRSWSTSHSPFFSRPELVVGLLAGLAAD